MNPTPIGVGEPAAGGENFDFWGVFCRIFMIYFPPKFEGHGGGDFYFPPMFEGHGGETEKWVPPHHGGEKSTPGQLFKWGKAIQLL